MIPASQQSRESRLAPAPGRVCTHNEWDPLEEIIVGRIEGVTVPVLTHEFKSMVRRDDWDFYRKHGGQPYPESMVGAAARALDNLQEVLEVKA